MPLRKAIDVALQAARGLGAAQEKGIVHRDLKPANLFLTNDGRVKVLDFGLAKLKQPEDARAGDTQAPTKTVDAETQAGVVLGTVGYMSPEQVRGEPADARSDIFSLGAILYEMLSGQRAFRGGSFADTMAAILKEDPPELSGERRKIPPGVERFVRHCLEKNAAERFQSARDLAFDLEALSGLPTTSAAGVGPTKSLLGKYLAPFSAALVLLTLGVAGDRILGKRAESNALPTFQQLTFKRGIIYSARFAPDGKTVIYSASWDGQAPQLYSTQPDSPESRPLDVKNSILFAVSSSTEMAISLGCNYLYTGECVGTLARAPLAGGAPREVVEDVNSADWSADGKELAVVRQLAGNFRVEFPLGKVLYERAGAWLRSVRISPRGDAVAFAEHPLGSEDAGTVVVLDRSGKQIVRSEFFYSVEGLSWSPRGDEVWFAATQDQQLANEIHALGLSGKDRVILRLPGFLRLHDVSRTGHLLLSREVLRGAMFFRGPGDRQERDLSWLDYSTVTDLSRDGSIVGFSEEGQAARNSFYAYTRRTDGLGYAWG
jgi:hypothetical protein